MAKRLRLSFTGSAVLTPAYPTDLTSIQGPLLALMPGARRARRSTFADQINAQFTFACFPYRHLVHEAEEDRDADYKYPDLKNVTTGVAFLEKEELRIEQPPPGGMISFDSSSSTAAPTLASTSAGYIARWGDFAAGGEAKVIPGPNDEGDFVRVVIPSGAVSSAFVHQPIARINFDYGPNSATKAYAQKIVVTVDFDDRVEEVTLIASRFGAGTRNPYKLRFNWYDSSEFEILFGNASLESLLNVLRGSFVGQDHEGDYDLEFEVLYDESESPVIHCERDSVGRLPLPQVMTLETLRVPCIASMITSEQVGVDGIVPPGAPTEPREPGEPRRGGGARGRSTR